jgi:ubiquinone/menaquinone biosynthesis C-methylase UbiE
MSSQSASDIIQSQHDKIRQVQKESWNKSSVGWKKWDSMTMQFMQPAGDEMIRMMNLNKTDVVLDVATGTGEPGLTIAKLAKDGKVIGTDLSEAMLEVAKENAHRRQINNFETVCCDVTALPFQDATFDAISCRFGLMFFPDLLLSMNEMIRVLKPGGRIAAAVWSNPEKNFWINAMMETMITGLELKRPIPGSPGPFRCEQPGMMEDLFRRSGLINIQQAETKSCLPCKTIELYWNFISEVAAPMAFSKADPEKQQQIKEEIFNKIKERFPDNNIQPESCAIVISGAKRVN